MKYRVAWKVIATGYCGHGNWQDDLALVAAWVKHENSELRGEIHHWVEYLTPVGVTVPHAA